MTVTLWVDEGVFRRPGLEALVFREHSVIGTVGAQENIAGESLENLKSGCEMFGNFRIVLVVYQLETRVHVGTANDHYVPLVFYVGNSTGPGSASARMTGGPAGGEDRLVQLQLLVVTQAAVDRTGVPAAVRVEILPSTPRGDHTIVPAHDTDLVSGQALKRRVSGDVVGMGMTG